MAPPPRIANAVEHGIKLKHGLRFTDIEIDRDGFITLDLRTAVINRLSVTRQRRESERQTIPHPRVPDRGIKL